MSQINVSCVNLRNKTLSCLEKQFMTLCGTICWWYNSYICWEGQVVTIWWHELSRQICLGNHSFTFCLFIGLFLMFQTGFLWPKLFFFISRISSWKNFTLILWVLISIYLLRNLRDARTWCRNAYTFVYLSFVAHDICFFFFQRTFA